jgi:protein-serine/threonine kinase
VYLVHHKVTGEAYAMKVLDHTRLRRGRLQYALTERNVLTYLRHPYIVQLFYSFQFERRLVLVLQYCSGGDLQGMLKRRGTLDVPLTQLYTAEVLLALSHIHVRDIVYRDMKPENVLVDGQGHVLLTDFGISKEQVSGLRSAHSFVGSPAFMAPELLGSDCRHGRLVDVYGLGVLVYCMLTGKPPFYSENRNELIQNILEAELTFPEVVKDELAQDLMRKLLEREPARRIGCNQTIDIQEHVFFGDMDWYGLLRREVQVPGPVSTQMLESCSEKPFETYACRTQTSGLYTSNVSRDDFAVENWDYVGLTRQKSKE